MRLNLLHLARNLRRSPASAGAAILTLSLTLGAGTSIFAVVHAILLTPLPFKDPQSLVILRETPLAQSVAAPRNATYATFEAWRERVRLMAELEGSEGTNLTLTGLGAVERLRVTDVTPGYLTLLGVTPALGRAFQPDDIGEPVAILSHAFWRGKLSADPAVVGREIVLGGQPHTILGVLPQEFTFELDPADLWRPLPLTPAEAAAAGYRVSVLARVLPHVSLTSLTDALDDVSRTSSPAARVVAVPVATAILGDAGRTLLLLGGAAALAMLIAFTNFAGLLIVRSNERRRELAIRSALGASRSDIAGQLLLEAQVLVGLGTGGGVLLALWMMPVVQRLTLEQFRGAHREVALNWEVVAAVTLAASACAWICVWLPARLAARRSVVDVLRRGATPPPRELLFRRALVVGEVALAFVLLTCVTLLGRTLLHLLDVNPGFNADRVLTLQVALPPAGYPVARVSAFHSALQRALEGSLGPGSTAIVNEIPLTGSGGRSLVSRRSGEIEGEAVVREASPGYFDVMRIPILTGRSFDPHDNPSVPARCVITQSLADSLFGGEQPIGGSIWVRERSQLAEIIGVAADVKHRALEEAVLPTVYLSGLQSPSPSSIVVVRSARPDAEVIATVREEVARLDSSVPVYNVRPMQDVVARSQGMAARRVLTATFLGFAVLALVLGAIGLFGVVAHDVASRRRELALRIALGADPRRILRTTLGQGGVMVGGGLVLGGLLSIWAAPAVSSSGLVTGPFDALSLAVSATTLALTGVAAVLPAALRAARTDPLIALRSE